MGTSIGVGAALVETPYGALPKRAFRVSQTELSFFQPRDFERFFGRSKRVRSGLVPMPRFEVTRTKSSRMKRCAGSES
jgi:hypothetical protein